MLILFVFWCDKRFYKISYCVFYYETDIETNAILYQSNGEYEMQRKRLKPNDAEKYGTISVNEYCKFDCDTDFHTYTTHLDSTQTHIFLLSYKQRMSVFESRHFTFNVSAKKLHKLVIGVPYRIEKLILINNNNKKKFLVYGFIKAMKFVSDFEKTIPNPLKDICVKYLDLSIVHVFGQKEDNHHSAQSDVMYR